MPIILLGLIISASIAIIELIVTLPSDLLSAAMALPKFLLLIGLGVTLAWMVGGD